MNDSEATITINGRLLSNAQAMTIRVALETFQMDRDRRFAVHLQSNGLGEDAHGIAMTKLYGKRIFELREMLSKKLDVPT